MRRDKLFWLICVSILAACDGSESPGQGERGPAGDPGERGATGATGSQGSAGAEGIVGPTGPLGPTGANGLAGPTGAAGATGATGAAGLNGAGAGVMVDATGTIVSGVSVSTMRSTTYSDPGGTLWNVSIETLIATPMFPQLVNIEFESADCSGPALFAPNGIGADPAPRASFTTIDAVDGGIVHARNDEALLVTGVMCSFRLPGAGCASIQPCETRHDLFRVDETHPVALPTISATPPLHPVF